MQNEKISLSEASRILGTSRAAIGRWGKEGMLTFSKEKGKKKVYRREVIALREMRDRSMKPQMIGEELLVLKYELLKLDRYLETVCDHSGLPLNLMTFTDDELTGWYDKAKKFVKEPGYDNRSFDYRTWHQVLQNIDEGELRRLSKLTDDLAPFLPFLKLCEKVVTQAMPERYKHARRPLLFLDWLDRFMLVQKQLRDKSIIYISERNPRLNPSLFIDMIMSGSMDAEALNPRESGVKPGGIM